MNDPQITTGNLTSPLPFTAKAGNQKISDLEKRVAELEAAIMLVVSEMASGCFISNDAWKRVKEVLKPKGV